MIQPAGQAPVKVFISYSRKDEPFRDGLVEHLKVLERENLITVWHDRVIPPGAEWKEEIDSHLDSAGMVLLLVSASFVESDYCQGIELTTALLRNKKDGIPTIIPILVRSVDWTRAPFAIFQALPGGGQPVSEWPDRDAAFTDIVKGIRKRLSGGSPSTPHRWATTRVRRSWKGLLLVALVLTFFSRVFFKSVTPDAPLDAAGTVVVFVGWIVVYAGVRYLVDRLLLMLQRSPKSTNGAQ